MRLPLGGVELHGHLAAEVYPSQVAPIAPSSSSRAGHDQPALHDRVVRLSVHRCILVSEAVASSSKRVARQWGHTPL